MSIPAPAPVTPARSRPGVVLFAATIFLSAYLLFQVQLIVAKFILPWFGGTPAVWTTCMLVFQLLLLAGYGYAHLLQKLLAKQEQIHVAVVIVSLVLLAALGKLWGTPILPGSSWKPQSVDYPASQILKLLLASIGLPFIVLSTTGPLLQRWFAHGGKSPYRLYAVSNVGSLLGLLAYPFLVEPALRLPRQAWMWSAGYLLFALGVFACAKARAGSATLPAAQAADASQPISRWRLAAWVLLPACASAMLLAATNLICQEVAVIAFLWVVPLCIYLLSFILCFDSPRWYRRGVFHPLYGVSLFTAVVALMSASAVPVVGQIGVHCLALFAVAMTCHGELFRLRPAESQLTAFYLAIAAGGALGGVFVALIAPRIFVGLWEYNVVILAAGVLLFAVLMSERGSWLQRSRLLQAAVVLLFVIAGVQYRAQAEQRTAGTLARSRNFFGVLNVVLNPERSAVGLRHGKTMHGWQFLDPKFRSTPTAYYTPESGVGRALLSRELWQGHPLRVGVIGLGVGTLAAYAQPDDYIHYYEIDPDVLKYSEGPQPAFTFLRDSRGKVQVSLGDARLLLEQEAASGRLGQFDVLVVDAFSSDSIPVHLLTREAIQLYRKHLRGPRSILAFHITNGTLDLRPVLLGFVQQEGLALKRILNIDPPSDWILMAEDDTVFNAPAIAAVRGAPMLDRPPVDWTDQYSNLASLVKWRSVGR